MFRIIPFSGSSSIKIPADDIKATYNITIDQNPFIEMIEEIFKTKYGFEGPLDELHTLLDSPLIPDEAKEYHKQIHGWSQDRNSIFIKDFHEYVDSNPKFNDVYEKFIRFYVAPLFPEGSRIVYQKTPNIRFSFPDSAAIGCDPNDPANIIGLHCDNNFGHNENEMNIVVPLTRMFSTNSIYYEPTLDSNIDPMEFSNVVLETNEFLEAYFNKLRHCNRINTTGKTRISFDIRVIPYTVYMDNYDFFAGTKFELGNYYIALV